MVTADVSCRLLECDFSGIEALPRAGTRFMQKAAGPNHYRQVGSAAACKRIHVVRAERALGKPLPKGAKVHHADGSKDPLAPLVICQDEAYHKLLHLRMKIIAAGGNPNTDKVCCTCKQAKHLDDFNRDRTGPLGRQGACRVCQLRRLKETARVHR